jgi:hypothetical protein
MYLYKYKKKRSLSLKQTPRTVSQRRITLVTSITTDAILYSQIKEYLHELGLQATKLQKRSLYSIMQRPLPPIDVATEAELADLEHFFNQNTG